MDSKKFSSFVKLSRLRNKKKETQTQTTKYSGQTSQKRQLKKHSEENSTIKRSYRYYRRNPRKPLSMITAKLEDLNQSSMKLEMNFRLTLYT